MHYDQLNLLVFSASSSFGYDAIGFYDEVDMFDLYRRFLPVLCRKCVVKIFRYEEF